MSTSAFANPYPKRSQRDTDLTASQRRSTVAGRSAASRPSAAAPLETAPVPADVFSAHPSSSWLGHTGEQLKLRVRVESVEQRERRTITYVVRAEDSDDLLEWSTQRRYGIAVGDRLALSGVVKAHVTRNDTPVTLLRDCFNPLRMA